MRFLYFQSNFLGGQYPDSDIVDLYNNDTIDFLLETEHEIRTLSGKSYSWIKCNQNFQGFYVTDYSFPSTTWSRFSNVLEAEPTVNKKNNLQIFILYFFLVLFRGR
jgi:hypothetical protein